MKKMPTNARLIRLREYLANAMLDPENNKLYIQDLELSIKYFKKLNLGAEIEVRQDEIRF
jgi:hypothetical protein